MIWWQYLLLVNLYLVLFYGFYVLLLRSETFFNLNRAYLVTSSLLSFFIPLIHSRWISTLFITQKVQQTIFVYAKPVAVYQIRPIEQTYISTGTLLFFIYAAGAAFLALRLVGQLLSLSKLIDQPEEATAFSFFKKISLGSKLEGREIIAEHERVHARQWHSADIMLIEVIAIINWFNPIVYLYKRGIKHIHEYIADRLALTNGTTKAEYALLLLSQSLKTPASQLVNPFYNQSLLKQRIMMLHKDRSKYRALLKYGLSAPLFMLMLVLSSAAVLKTHTVKFFNSAPDVLLLSPTSAVDVKSRQPEKSKVLVNGGQDNAVIVANENKPASIKLKANSGQVIATDPIFLSVEQEPEFKGGMRQFYQFLAANLNYPEAMIKFNVQGKVFVTMTVEKDGSLTDIKSLRDIGYGSAEEAIRVLKLSPKWQPGYQNGHPVRVRYTLPILFNLVSLKNEPDSLTKVTYTYKSNDLNPSTEKIAVKADTAGRKINMIRADDFDFQTNALYLLDGKVIAGLDGIDPNNIRSVKVLRHITKDNTYYTAYGAKALNGVILIELKKPGESK